MNTHHSASQADFHRPSDLLWQSEGVRAAAEMMLFWTSAAELSSGRPGDGHPVLVLPGFLSDDLSTTHLRRILLSRGYRSVGWQLGPNLGPTQRIWSGLTRMVEELNERSGRRVSLIGQSLGGIFARELARRQPHRVRQVITLGSPYRLSPASPPTLTTVGHLYAALDWLHTNFLADVDDAERLALTVPTTSIYSRMDGVVPWRACIDVDRSASENIRVDSSHCGMAFHPQIVRIILSRLAQPESSWQPYRPT